MDDEREQKFEKSMKTFVEGEREKLFEVSIKNMEAMRDEELKRIRNEIRDSEDAMEELKIKIKELRKFYKQQERDLDQLIMDNFKNKRMYCLASN